MKSKGRKVGSDPTALLLGTYLDLPHHVHALRHLPEHHVLPI